MLGHKLKKPPIAGLMASISVFIVMVAYTFIAPLNDLVELAIFLCLDTIVFVAMLLTVSRDIQWLEIFSVSKFQKQIGIITIVIAAMFAIGMVAVSQYEFDQINAAAILITMVGLISTLIYSCAESAKKELKQKSSD